jgi:hypothetical protein
MVPVRYFVVRHDNKWRIEFEDTYQNGFTTQKDALIGAMQMARLKAREGGKVEVLVQSDAGVWHTEWTEADI